MLVSRPLAPKVPVTEVLAFTDSPVLLNATVFVPALSVVVVPVLVLPTVTTGLRVMSSDVAVKTFVAFRPVLPARLIVTPPASPSFSVSCALVMPSPPVRSVPPVD